MGGSSIFVSPVWTACLRKAGLRRRAGVFGDQQRSPRLQLSAPPPTPPRTASRVRSGRRRGGITSLELDHERVSLTRPQRVAANYIASLAQGRTWEVIFDNLSVMEFSWPLSTHPVLLLLNAVYTLHIQRVNGLSKLLHRASCFEGSRGDRQFRGTVIETIMLGHIAARAATPRSPRHLVRLGERFPIEFCQERYTITGGSGTNVRFRLSTVPEIYTLEIDGQRADGTAVEIKSSKTPLTLKRRPEHVHYDAERALNLRNQARKYEAAIQIGDIPGVEYHLVTPAVDADLIRFLGRVVSDIMVFHYGSIQSGEREQLLPQPARQQRRRAPRPKPASSRQPSATGEDRTALEGSAADDASVATDTESKQRTVKKKSDQKKPALKKPPQKKPAKKGPRYNSGAWKFALSRYFPGDVGFGAVTIQTSVRTVVSNARNVHKNLRGVHLRVLQVRLQEDLGRVVSNPALREDAASLKGDIDAAIARVGSRDSLGISFVKEFSPLLSRAMELIQKHEG